MLYRLGIQPLARIVKRTRVTHIREIIAQHRVNKRIARLVIARGVIVGEYRFLELEPGAAHFDEIPARIENVIRVLKLHFNAVGTREAL